MPPGQTEREDDEETTPRTRSYVDALLRGNLSPDQLARLRGEIAGHAEEAPPRAPRGFGSSRPPSAPPPSWPAGRSYAPAADDDTRTAVRSYVPPADLDVDSDRTVVRSYVPPEDLDALDAGIDVDSNRTVVRSYVPPEDSGVVEIGTMGLRAPDLPDPDDTRTAAYTYTTELVDYVDLGDLGDFGPVAPDEGDAQATGSSPPLGGSPEGLLEQTYLATLGGLASVPRLAVAPGRVTALSLGQKEAFVLACVDGGSSIEDILDISSLPRLATLRILYDLLQQVIIDVGRPSRPG